MYRGGSTIVYDPITIVHDNPMPAATPHKLADGRYECQNCLRKFTKNERTYKDPSFCQDSCRKNFHANGGLSLKKVEARLQPKVREWTRDEWNRAAEGLRSGLLAELTAMFPQRRKPARERVGN
jgi:hypothetical protein